MPNARTKQAAASAAASASSAPSAGIMIFRPHCGRSGWTRIAWKVSHSEAKPFNGGRADDRRAADQEGERGLRHAVDQPAEVSMSRSPVALSTAPAPKNSRLLNTVWFNAWNSAAVSPSAAAAGNAVGAERQRQPQADENDADVLHRVIGEQPLKVVLHQRMSTPSTAVMPPSASTTVPAHHWLGPSRSKTMRMKA